MNAWDYLKAHGWREEVVSVGCKPVLTNVPEGQRLCYVCSRWLPESLFPTQLGRCSDCGQMRTTAALALRRKRLRKSHERTP